MWPDLRRLRERDLKLQFFRSFAVMERPLKASRDLVVFSLVQLALGSEQAPWDSTHPVFDSAWRKE